MTLAHAPCGCKGTPQRWCGYDTIIVVWACEEHRAKANILGKRMIAVPPGGECDDRPS